MSTTAPKLRRVVYRLRTEREGPYRETAAVAVGVFVGCTPLYGLHLLICWVLAVALRLNRLKVYLASNLSNPIVAPFLVFTELQVGAWLRHGRMHPLEIETVTAVSPWSFGLDIVVGSVAVGGVLATVAAALTYAMVRRASDDALFAGMARQASDRYVGASITAWEIARWKLRGDPVYKEVLDGGLLPSGGTLVDIGCGQGLMLAFLAEAGELVRGSSWPVRRALPPLFDRLVGIETRPRMAGLARSALGVDAEIVQADARAMKLEACSAVLLFDVLHRMSKEAQETLLAQVSVSVLAGGVILVREADSSAGWRFSVVRLVNRLKAVALGSWRQRFFYRNRDEWLVCFAGLGLRAEPSPMHGANAPGKVLFRVSR
jgi:uncharacterized protein (DUF2062 family)